MSDQFLKDKKNTPFKFKIGSIKFQDRPGVLDAAYRVSWRIPFTIFLIHRLAGPHSVSLRRLTLFNWQMQSSDRFDVLRRAVLEGSSLAAASTKHDPGLVRTLLYLSANGYLESKNNKYKLSAKGKSSASDIEKSEDLFILEKSLFTEFPKTAISETRINNIWAERQK